MFIHISIQEKFTQVFRQHQRAASATKVGTGWEWKAERKWTQRRPRSVLSNDWYFCELHRMFLVSPRYEDTNDKIVSSCFKYAILLMIQFYEHVHEHRSGNKAKSKKSTSPQQSHNLFEDLPSYLGKMRELEPITYQITVWKNKLL